MWSDSWRSLHHQDAFALVTHYLMRAVVGLPERSRRMLVVEKECRCVALLFDHILRVSVLA